MTPRDIAWQEKALDEILARTGGWKVEAMNEPDVAEWEKPAAVVEAGGDCMMGPPAKRQTSRSSHADM
jgi:hypothetical protein